MQLNLGQAPVCIQGVVLVQMHLCHNPKRACSLCTKTPWLFSCWGLSLRLFIAIHPGDVIFPYLIARFLHPTPVVKTFLFSQGKKELKKAKPTLKISY